MIKCDRYAANQKRDTRLIRFVCVDTAYEIRMLFRLLDARAHPFHNVGLGHAAVNVEREQWSTNDATQLIAQRRLAAAGIA